MLKKVWLRLIEMSVLALILGVGALVLPTKSAHAAAVRPAFTCDTGTRCYYEFMYQGDYLNGTTNDYVFFGQYRLVMQSDGNLVIYSNGSPIWATGTNNYVEGATYKAILQTNGDFEVYCYNGIYNRCGIDGNEIWASGTTGKSIDHLLLAVDPNAATWGNFLLIDQYNQDQKQSCNIYHTSNARSIGPMTGPGQSCYPPLYTFPAQGGITVPEPDE